MEEALSKVVPVEGGASQTAKKSVLDEGRRPVSPQLGHIELKYQPMC